MSITKSHATRRHALQQLALLGAGFGGAMSLSGGAAISQDQPTTLRVAVVHSETLPVRKTRISRIVQRVANLSNNAITIVPEVVSIASDNLISMVKANQFDGFYASASFAQNELPAAAFFSGIPFGLTALEHLSWLQHGGGQALWNEVYQEIGLNPVVSTISDIKIGGWFHKEITTLDDLKDLKIYLPGLAGDVFTRLGAIPVKIPVDNILNAFRSKLIDGVSFLGPADDLSMKFYLPTRNYYWPGMPGGELIYALFLSQQTTKALNPNIGDLIAKACFVETLYNIIEELWLNAAALQTLQEHYGVVLRNFTPEIVDAVRKSARALFQNLSQQDELTTKVSKSYQKTLDLLSPLA